MKPRSQYFHVHFDKTGPDGSRHHQQGGVQTITVGAGQGAFDSVMLGHRAPIFTGRFLLTLKTTVIAELGTLRNPKQDSGPIGLNQFIAVEDRVAETAKFYDAATIAVSGSRATRKRLLEPPLRHRRRQGGVQGIAPRRKTDLAEECRS